jgi:CHAD domain-containing protein
MVGGPVIIEIFRIALRRVKCSKRYRLIGRQGERVGPIREIEIAAEASGARKHAVCHGGFGKVV